MANQSFIYCLTPRTPPYAYASPDWACPSEQCYADPWRWGSSGTVGWGQRRILEGSRGLVHHRRDGGEHPAKRSRRTICWISRFPGFDVWMYLTICLDLITLLHFAIAWISELPGFDLLLDFTISLILPFPGFDNFWDFTFSWFCNGLDGGYRVSARLLGESWWPKKWGAIRGKKLHKNREIAGVWTVGVVGA